MRWLGSVRVWTCTLLAVLSQVLTSQAAFAQGYVTTGNTGPQTQIDTSHTSTIYLVVTGASVSFGGGNITIKRGSNAVESEYFKLWLDTTGTTTPLDTIALAPVSARSSFTATIFQIPGNRTLEHFPTKWKPVGRKKVLRTNNLERRSDSVRSKSALSAGNSCTTVMSAAADHQNGAYDIGGESGCPVLTTSGNPGAVHFVPRRSCSVTAQSPVSRMRAVVQPSEPVNAQDCMNVWTERG